MFQVTAIWQLHFLGGGRGRGAQPGVLIGSPTEQESTDNTTKASNILSSAAENEVHDNAEIFRCSI